MKSPVVLADMTNSRSHLFSLTFNNAEKNLELFKAKLSPLCECIILQSLSRVFKSRAANGGGIVFS